MNTLLNIQYNCAKQDKTWLYTQIIKKSIKKLNSLFYAKTYYFQIRQCWEIIKILVKKSVCAVTT